MGAKRAGKKLDRCTGLVVAELGMLDRPAGFWVDTARPGDRCKSVGRDQLASLAVEDIEEPVFVGLHQDLALLSVDRQVSEDQLLNGIVVPLLSRRRLVVPDIGAGIGVER